MSAWMLTRDAGSLHAELARFIADYCARPENFHGPGTRLVARKADAATRQSAEDFVRTFPLSPQSLASDGDIAQFASEVMHEWIERNPALRGEQRQFAHARVGELVALLEDRLRAEKPHPRQEAPAPASSLRSVFMALGDGAQSGNASLIPPAVLGKEVRPPIKPQEPSAELMRLYRSLLTEQTGETTQQLPSLGTPASSSTALSEGAGDDQQIFHQLRMQLETYIKQACASYGLKDPGGDPMRTLDALRASRLVDEAGLRLAEGIFALCERVISGDRATLSDYREAMLLYLLYHRAHLGA